MANRLKMAKVNAVLRLHSQGWSHRRIAAHLGIHRETVSRYLAGFSADTDVAADESENSKPAKAPPGVRCQNRPQAPLGSAIQNRPKRPSGRSEPRRPRQRPRRAARGAAAPTERRSKPSWRRDCRPGGSFKIWSKKRFRGQLLERDAVRAEVGPAAFASFPPAGAAAGRRGPGRFRQRGRRADGGSVARRTSFASS